MKRTLISGLFAIVLAAPGLAYVPPEVPGGKIQVPNEISEIRVEAGDMVTVMLERSAGPEARATFSTRGKVALPVTMKLEGRRLLVKVSGLDADSERVPGPVTTTVRLYIPSGRDVSVIGANLVVSGDVAAKSFTVKARSLSMHFLKIAAGDVSVDTVRGQLKFRLSGAKRLLVSAAEVSGRIFVPAGAKVDCPVSGGLEIVRAAGK